MPDTPETDAPQPKGLWAVFSDQGQPAWIGPEPIADAEELPYAVEIDGEAVVLDVAFLAAHLRTPEGRWVPRPPPPPPTEAELAAMAAEIARQAAEAELAASEEMERQIAWRLGPDIALRSMGKITIAELTRREAVIRAQVEAGN